MRRLLEHPALYWLFDRIERAGRIVRADELASVAEGVCPLPPPYLLLQCLVDSGYLSVEGPAVTPGVALHLTEAATQHLRELRAAEQARWSDHEHVTTGPPPLSEDDIVAFLAAIERGDVTLSAGRRPRGEGGTGLVSFAASNGWRIKVFEDEGRWAYLDSVLRDNRYFASFATIRRTMPRVVAYAPGDELAARLYGIRPSDHAPSKRRWKGTDQDVSKVRPFDFVTDVLEGRRRVTLGPDSSKLMRILFDAEVDAIASQEALTAYVGVRKEPAFQYDPELVPAVVSELMVRAGLSAVRSPVVLGLSAGDVRTTDFPRWSCRATLVWLVPEGGRLVLRTRVRPGGETGLFVQPMPDEGPLRLPTPLPAWQKPSARYRDVAPPRTCPHCRATSTRFRDLGEALVCGACGRSFETAAIEAEAG